MHMKDTRPGPVMGAWALCHAHKHIAGLEATMFGNGKERGGLRGEKIVTTKKTDIKHEEDG